MAYHPSSILLSLTPIFLITSGYFVLYHNDFHLPSSSIVSSCKTTTKNTSKTPNYDDITLRLFIGIITAPLFHEKRLLLRSVYTLQKRNLYSAEVDVRFVFCGYVINEEEKMHLEMEINLFNDIILLNCSENLNDGKTYTFFSSLPSLLVNDARYDYVIKSDDDAYFHLDNLKKYLVDKPRDDLYAGMEAPCTGRTENCGVNNTFMAGFGYILSWDLVQWIAESNIAKDNKIGLEDVTLGKWLNMGNKGKNRYDGCPDQFYDYKGESQFDYYRHDFVPNTVAVHKLKKGLYWAETLKYFNVTRGLRV